MNLIFIMSGCRDVERYKRNGLKKFHEKSEFKHMMVGIVHPLGSFAPHCNIVTDDNGVHHDHDLNDDEVGSDVHHLPPPKAFQAPL